MGTTASQITSLTIVYSTVYSDADQRKHESSAPLAFVWTGEFPAQMASNAENVSIWWRHHAEDCWTSQADQECLTSWPWLGMKIFILNTKDALTIFFTQCYLATILRSASLPRKHSTIQLVYWAKIEHFLPSSTRMHWPGALLVSILTNNKTWRTRNYK